jgi:hypothetical protein
MKTSKQTVKFSKIGKKTLVFVSSAFLISFGLIAASALNTFPKSTDSINNVETSNLLTGQELTVVPGTILDPAVGPVEVNSDDADCAYPGHIDEVGDDADCIDLIHVDVIQDDADCTDVGHIEEMGDDADCTDLIASEVVLDDADCTDAGHIEEIGDDADCTDSDIVDPAVEIRNNEMDIAKDKNEDAIDDELDAMDEE